MGSGACLGPNDGLGQGLEGCETSSGLGCEPLNRREARGGGLAVGFVLLKRCRRLGGDGTALLGQLDPLGQETAGFFGC